MTLLLDKRHHFLPLHHPFLHQPLQVFLKRHHPFRPTCLNGTAEFLYTIVTDDIGNRRCPDEDLAIRDAAASYASFSDSSDASE